MPVPLHKQLLQYAKQLVTLASPDEILASAGRSALALTGAVRCFASCTLPGQSWEHGKLIEVDTRSALREVSGAGRSALFAVHRRIVGARAPLALGRDATTEAVFAGLGCGASTARLIALPFVHRTGRLWGELVLIGPDGGATIDPDVDGLDELIQLTTVALENGQRLSFARRDQDRLQLLSEATEDALWDMNLDAPDLWWGGGIVKLVGSNADPVEHTLRWKLAQIHPQDRDAVERSLLAATTSSAPAWRAEYRFRRSNGDYLHIEDRGYFLRDASGRAYRMLGAMRDVTALHTLLEREHHARAEAESASRAKDEFLAMLGHELRNPLAPIVTGLQLIRIRAGAGIDKELTVVERQAQHLIRLVDDLLDISRIAHGKVELKKERIEAGAVIAGAIETANPLIEERRHTLIVNAPEIGLELDVDRARIAQALSNLLTNAAKYTEPGGSITVRATRSADRVAISVRDTGIGIAPEMLPRVFTMFVQENQALDRARGGLGLGLSIVRSLVELHGGTVAAASAGRGAGSEFTLELPLAVRDPLPAHASISAVRAATGAGRRIMVVDDNEDAADLLSLLLESRGNTTAVAHDATAALDLVGHFLPDLAVLDIGLPVMDGFELARRLRQQPHTAGMRLVALTGYGQASDQRRATDAGFDAHLVKPVEIDALDAVIQRLLSPNGA